MRAAFAPRGQEVARGFRDPHAQTADLTFSEPTQQTVDALMKLDLPAGVDVEIKAFENRHLRCGRSRLAAQEADGRHKT